MSRPHNNFGYVLIVAGTAFIALLTLIPDPGGAREAAATPLYCVVCGSLGGVDVLLNLMLFVPLGIGLGLAGFSWRRALVVAGLLSFSIELLQLTVIAGRDASLGDIITNTTGGAFGALAGPHWRRVLLPARRSARRLALAYATLLCGIWLVTAWSLGLRLPTSAPWYGQWAPDLGNYKPFLGRVLGLKAGEMPLPPGRAPDQERLRDAVAARPTMAFKAVLGPMPARLAPVGAIHDEWQRQVILIGQDRNDLAFRVSLKGSGLKLRVPTVNLRNGMAGQPGDTVYASGGLRDGAFELESQVGTTHRSRRLPLTASWGWSLVLPWDSVLGEEARGLTALWIVGLLALLAHWSFLAGRAATTIPVVTAAILLWAIPNLAGFEHVHWSEWAAAAAGIGLGAVTAAAAFETGGGKGGRSSTPD